MTIIPTKLLVKREAVADHADLVAELRAAEGERVDVQTARLRSTASAAESFDELLLLLGGQDRIAEKDDSALRPAWSVANPASGLIEMDTHTSRPRALSLSSLPSTSRILSTGLPSGEYALNSMPIAGVDWKLEYRSKLNAGAGVDEDADLLERSLEPFRLVCLSAALMWSIAS